MYNEASQIFQTSNDADWLDILLRSVYEPVINGIEMPRFPHGSIQRQFVGSADEEALREAFVFYQHVKGYASALAMPLNPETKFLDFGSGWGRYTRLFWHDIRWDNIVGVDIDPGMVSLCRATGTPGQYLQIDPKGELPFEDNSFDCVISYSVFSHLPENVATHWMSELSRVAKPGCVLAYTTEPRRFLDFILEIPHPAPTEWHKGLARHASIVPQKLLDFDDDRFVYIPTSGGEHRTADIYGDACIPRKYIASNWKKYFNLVDYIDDADRFWQAFVIAQKA